MRCLKGALCLVVLVLGTASSKLVAAPIGTGPGPATAGTTLPPVPFVSAHAGVFRIASAPGAWGGPRTATDATLSDRVASYAIQATLHPHEHTVDASEVMTWRNRSHRPIRHIYLHMYLNAFEGSGSLFAHERRMFSHTGSSRGGGRLHDGQWGYVELGRVRQGGHDVAWHFVHPDGGPESDHTVVEMDLPQAVPARGTLTLHIGFHDQLPRVVARTGWWGRFNMVAQWFPKIAVLELPGERGAMHLRWNAHAFHFHSEFYADFGDYDVRLTVPSGYTVGAVGHQMAPPVTKDGTVTYHFRQDDVEDFAWMAAPGYRTLSGSWAGAGSPQVTVRVIYPPEYKAVAGPILKATTDALAYFSHTLGPYPYRTVTVIVPPYNTPGVADMEYPTLFTDEHAVSAAVGSAKRFEVDYATIHEFGHNYFMGMVGSNEFEEPLLDEGVNDYWDNRMLAARHENQPLFGTFWRELGFTASLRPFVSRRIGGVLAQPFPADPLDANAWDRMSNGSYGRVYSRSDTFFRTLENLVGQQAMERAMKLYFQRWKFRHPDAADLRDALAEGTGRPKLVKQLFDAQVYSAHRVDASIYDLSSTEQVPRPGTEIKDGQRVSVSAGQVARQIKAARAAWKKDHGNAGHGGPYSWHTVVTVRRSGPPMPQTLRVNFADGSHRIVHWTDGRRWQRFVFDGPSKAVSAELDPQQMLLLDANMLNDSHATKADGRASRRWSADARALLQNVYTLMGTL